MFEATLDLQALYNLQATLSGRLIPGNDDKDYDKAPKAGTD